MVQRWEKDSSFAINAGKSCHRALDKECEMAKMIFPDEDGMIGENI